MDDRRPNRWQQMVADEWGGDIDMADEDETRGIVVSQLFQIWENWPDECDVPPAIERLLKGDGSVSKTRIAAPTQSGFPRREIAHFKLGHPHVNRSR